MKQLKRTLLTLVLLITAATGAWADTYSVLVYLYLEVDGTSATLKYGEPGSNPYYTVDAYGDASWSASNYTNVTTITVDASCVSHGETILKYLFSGCSALTTINGLENLKTSGVTNMNGMFLDCAALTTLDLSGWNTASVTNMASMFEGCTNLANIYVGKDWSTASVEDSDGMFHNCTKLPNWNSNVTDKTKAHTGADGYLSEKPITITPTANANEWTMKMPAGNVLLEVEYYDPMLTLATNPANGGTIELADIQDNGYNIYVNGQLETTITKDQLPYSGITAATLGHDASDFAELDGFDNATWANGVLTINGPTDGMIWYNDGQFQVTCLKNRPTLPTGISWYTESGSETLAEVEYQGFIGDHFQWAGDVQAHNCK